MSLDIVECHNNLYIHTGFVINKHPGVSRTTLVDAVNDKCATGRQKQIIMTAHCLRNNKSVKLLNFGSK